MLMSNNKKKIAVVVAALSVPLWLAACGGGSGSDDQTGSGPASGPQTHLPTATVVAKSDQDYFETGQEITYDFTVSDLSQNAFQTTALQGQQITISLNDNKWHGDYLNHRVMTVEVDKSKREASRNCDIGVNPGGTCHITVKSTLKLGYNRVVPLSNTSTNIKGQSYTNLFNVHSNYGSNSNVQGNIEHYIVMDKRIEARDGEVKGTHDKLWVYTGQKNQYKYTINPDGAAHKLNWSDDYKLVAVSYQDQDVGCQLSNENPTSTEEVVILAKDGAPHFCYIKFAKLPNDNADGSFLIEAKDTSREKYNFNIETKDGLTVVSDTDVASV